MDKYEQRGVSSQKEDVHQARKNRDKANQYNRTTTFKVLIEDTSN